MSDVAGRRQTGEQEAVQPAASNGRSRIIIATMGLAVVLAGTLISFGVWKGSVVTDEEARDTTGAIHKRITKVEVKADKAIDTTKTMGKDIRVIKCILLAKSRDAKTKCALIP